MNVNQFISDSQFGAGITNVPFNEIITVIIAIVAVIIIFKIIGKITKALFYAAIICGCYYLITTPGIITKVVSVIENVISRIG